VLGVVARAWIATLRVRVWADPGLAQVAGRPWVLAFWHGTQWPLLAWRRRRDTVVLVSWSSDGAMQASVMAVQGLRVVRGSSSRGGARGLAAVVRAMRRDGVDAAFAVDGPRGPHGAVKGGVILAARAANAVVVPMAAAVHHGVVLKKTWDRFVLAWPFGRVDVVLGAPVDPASGPASRRELEEALARLNATVAAWPAQGARTPTAIASTSTRAPRGSADTWTVLRAGYGSAKKRP
jgi:lysophospholipid acyltransferase (LPLAT)-like uncharacterized protein